jgi:protein-tyrosine phosphatase
MQPLFVDCHSHAVPSGDDGVQSAAEGIALCSDAAAHGTRLLFATPHVFAHLPLSAERERLVRQAYDAIRGQTELELRLGFELTPDRMLLREDPARYRLEGTEFVLMEVPFQGPADQLWALAEHVERAGFEPVIAHPERTEAVLSRPELARELAERGWRLQVNATSLLGRHGPEMEELGWQLVEDGTAALVASDGHRATRPARLDEAYELVKARVGEERALPLFDGSALGLATATPLQPAESK